MADRAHPAALTPTPGRPGQRAPLLGIDLGGTKIEALMLGADGKALWRERVPTPQGDYRATLAVIAGLVARAEAASGARNMCVGIGTPGSETASGKMRNANSTCLNGQPLRSDLQALLARPMRIANDANCLALSEASDGAAAGAAVVFAVILGTGVGGGLVVNRELLAGANGLAGEWGHNPLPWADAETDADPAACYCGKHGCIETWLSGPALARDHGRHTGEQLDAAQIAARAASGDAAAEASLARYASRLARALAAVINLVDPDLIVLGGGLSRIDSLYTRVPHLWPRHVFSAGADQPLRTRLVQSLHGAASGVRGAARLWRDAAQPVR
ncbi:MAG TPA: ROK family protein [Burkholderiaceae bacterium]|nr:ROK family protein [Burkholderiaceae bacterium]